MRPTFEVQGDDSGPGECTGDFNAFRRGHGEMERADLGDARRTQIEDGHGNREAARNFGDSFVPDGVTGEIDGMFGGVRNLQHKTDDRSAVVFGRAVPCGRSYDAQTAIANGQIKALPGIQSNAISTEAFGAFDSGEYCFRPGQQASARSIEIIGVVVVAEEHEINGAGIQRGDGRARGLQERHWPGGVLSGRRIEGGIGEELRAAKFQKGSWSTDIREFDGVGWHLGFDSGGTAAEFASR